MNALWAILWHAKGALWVMPLSDAIRMAMERRMEGAAVYDAIVGVEETFEKAKERELEIKRQRKAREN